MQDKTVETQQDKTVRTQSIIHTEEPMVDQNSVNAQPISECTVYFIFLEQGHCYYRQWQVVLFDVVVLFHLLAIADKIYGDHCAPWSVAILIKYTFP